MKIVIIGNSAASTAAIESIRKYDQKSTLVQLTDESDLLYSRCLLTYYLTDKLDKKGVAYREPDFHNKMNVHLQTNSRVVTVDPIQQILKCEHGKNIDFEKLLICTGGSPKLPNYIQENTDGIFVLRTLNDADHIKKRLFYSKNAVILGGGLIGMRAAYALNKCGLGVTVIIRSNRILSQMLDFDSAQIILKQLKNKGIQVLTQTDLTEIVIKNKKLIAVKTTHNQTIDCELLLVAKGVKPNIELIQNTNIKKGYGIKINPTMQTNYPFIFAAGDVAETFDITLEDYTINALWTCAVQQGRIAGLNIIGKKISYDGTLGMNSLNFFGIPLISFGITAPKDESKYKILRKSRPNQNIYKKIILEGNRIKGIILIGKISNAGVLLSLIRKKTDVSDFADELLSDHFNYGSILKHGGKSEFEKYYKNYES
jgi:NAD(P)H-nitrite reductase large subunit